MSLRPNTFLLAIAIALSVGCAAAPPPPPLSPAQPPPPTSPTVLTAGTPAASTAGAPSTGANTGVKMPVNFQRDGFLANSMLVTKEPNNTGLKPGVHHIYVNPAGLDRLKQGGSTKYPDGTVFVDDVREFSLDDGVYHQGPHKFITTMVRDSKAYASTGGWGFQAWLGGDPTKPIVTDPVTQCFTCHTSQSGNDFVFSTYLQ
jgi:Cytochrome P460